MSHMNASLIGRLSPRAPRRADPARASFRPRLDALEDRTVPASGLTAALPLSVDLHAPTAGATQLTGDVLLAGQDVGNLAIAPTTQQASGSASQVLNLHLDPIHLNLLGLHVDTSAICLDVTATRGQGVLGDLLSGLTGSNPLDLGGILGALHNSTGQINRLLNQLEGVLDGVLSRPMSVTGVLGTPVGNATPAQAQPGFCDVLNLSLGPVDLNLLGLGVSLDNCNDGPVTVDVTADPNGGLLGGLLCGLADGINLPGGGLGGLVNRLDHLIDDLAGLAGRLDDLGPLNQLPGNLGGRISNLLDRLESAADNVDSPADLNRFLRSVEHTVHRLDQIVDRLEGNDHHLTDRLDRLADRLEGILHQLVRLLDR